MTNSDTLESSLGSLDAEEHEAFQRFLDNVINPDFDKSVKASANSIIKRNKEERRPYIYSLNGKIYRVNFESNLKWYQRFYESFLEKTNYYSSLIKTKFSRSH
jgi:hypothetical protein